MSSGSGYGIITYMTATLIILLVIVALIAVSIALSRTSREAQIVRDDEFVELEGSWIRYRVTGEGPPVLLVHGFLSSSRIWGALVGRLSERFTVYSLDLRGFGESDKPLTGYGVRHGGRLLHSFCSRFGLGDVSLVAHDVGGDMAVKFAADHPEFVRSVTLVAAPANEEQIDLPTTLWLATLPVIGPLFYALGQYVRPVCKLWLKPFVSDKRDLPEELLEDATLSVPAAVRSTFNTVRHEISRERLGRQAQHISSPILIIAGEEDRIVDPQATEVWASNASHAEVAILEGCGHLPMIELPEEFNDRLLSFLAGDERRLAEKSHYRRYRASHEEPSSGESRSKEPKSGGIDGLEPDEEASASEPQAGAGGPKRGGDRFHGAGHYQEDETRDLSRESLEPRSFPEEEPAGDLESEPPRRAGGDRSRGVRGEYIIPEIPDDLFRWSDLDETRHRKRGDGGGGGEERDERANESDDRDGRDRS